MPCCSCWFLIVQLFNPRFTLSNPTLLRFYWAVLALQGCVSSRRTATGISSLLFGCSVESDPFATMDCSPPGSSVRGGSQARTLQWVVFPSPGGLPDPGIEAHRLFGVRVLHHRAAWAACESACACVPALWSPHLTPPHTA